jgi:hypothetical protein
MRRALAVLTILSALGGFSTMNAGAAPIGALSVSPHSDVVLVADGCGRGFHRNRFGICRHNVGPHHGRCWWVRRHHRHGERRLVCR